MTNNYTNAVATIKVSGDFSGMMMDAPDGYYIVTIAVYYDHKGKLVWSSQHFMRHQIDDGVPDEITKFLNIIGVNEPVVLHIKMTPVDKKYCADVRMDVL